MPVFVIFDESFIDQVLETDREMHSQRRDKCCSLDGAQYGSHLFRVREQRWSPLNHSVSSRLARASLFSTGHEIVMRLVSISNPRYLKQCVITAFHFFALIGLVRRSSSGAPNAA